MRLSTTVSSETTPDEETWVLTASSALCGWSVFRPSELLTEVALARSGGHAGGLRCPWIPEREPGTCPLIAFLGSYPGLSWFHAGRYCPRTHLQEPFHSPGPRRPASRVNSQDPMCFSKPVPPRVTPPQHTPSHPHCTPSCTCAMLNACVASTPQRPSSVLGRSLQSLHIHFITTWEAKSRPSQAHKPQYLCLCSAPPACQAQEETYSPQLLLSLKKKCKLFSCSKL